MTKLAASKYTWWFFAVAIIFVYFFGLNIPLVGPDEPRYAQVAREMLERGNWITPTLGGFEWFEKPALLYWLQIVGYKIFGVNEFAARFGSALFGLGTVASLWILGRFGRIKETERESVDFANSLALIAATMLGILVFSRAASFDIIVTFPLTASLVGFFIADRSENGESRKRILAFTSFYFFAGLAVLAKGLIGIVFPFGIVAGYLVLSRRFPSKQLFASLLWGVPLLLVVAATWNVPMYLQHGWKFIDEFYIQHHFQRYTSNKYQHSQPFYFYFWVLPLMTIPWLPWFIGGLFSLVRARLRPATPRTDQSDEALTNFAIAWVSVPLVFFSLSGSMLPGYILPAIPAAAVFAALYVWQFAAESSRKRMMVIVTSGVMLIAIPLALMFAVPKYAKGDSVKRLVQTANSVGYAGSKLAGFRTLSHNAEFYAAGRLIRNENGVQKRFEDPSELFAYSRTLSEPLLVLVPLKQLGTLGSLASEPLADNGDLAIVVIGRR
jgi:4-amino-4-deoxy-L-arabinose transferase-like glycosyltransferase